MAPHSQGLVRIGDAPALAPAPVSVRTLRRRVKDGTLPAYRVGRLVMIDPADLARLVSRIPATGSAA